MLRTGRDSICKSVYAGRRTTDGTAITNVAAEDSLKITSRVEIRIDRLAGQRIPWS